MQFKVNFIHQNLCWFPVSCSHTHKLLTRKLLSSHRFKNCDHPNSSMFSAKLKNCSNLEIIPKLKSFLVFCVDKGHNLRKLRSHCNLLC